MKKAILVGNGFSSQLESGCKSNTILSYLETLFPDDFKKTNDLFQAFRLDPDTFQSPFDVEYWTSPFDEEDCQMYSATPNSTYENLQIKRHVCNILSGLGFSNVEKIASRYFFQDGLAYEIYRKNFISMETPFKIAEMAKNTGLLPKDLSTRFNNAIKSYFVDTLKKYNNDFPEKNGIATYKKSCAFFQKYSTVFTTNYDLFLDSLVHDKVKHLHGSLNFASPYKKDNKTIHNDCYLIIGADAYSKMTGMKPYSKRSLFMKYYDSLSTEDFDEFHILGYSGENDQHINNAIRKNHRIRKIVFYANPNKLNDNKYYYMIGKQFRDSPCDNYCKTNFDLRSWNEVWELLK